MVSHGYHLDENGRKYIRVYMSLDVIIIKVKIERHKEMHIKSASVWFPYNISDNWVTMNALLTDIGEYDIMGYIDERCKEIWFV